MPTPHVLWLDLDDLGHFPDPAATRQRVLESVAGMQAQHRAATPCPDGWADLVLIPHFEAMVTMGGEIVLRPDVGQWLEDTCAGQYAVAEPVGVDQGDPFSAPALRMPDGAALAFKMRWR